MVDTARTKAAILALLADNTDGDISEQDVRDWLVSTFVETTKGDLAGIDGSGIQARLAAGANDTLLVADSTETLGLKWATAAVVAALLDHGNLAGLGDPDHVLYALLSGAPFTGDVTITAGNGLVVGHTAQIDFGAIPEFQVLGIDTPGSSMGFARFEDNASGPDVRFLKSRGTNIGDNAIGLSGDTLGRLRFQCADGGDFNTTAAELIVRIDGTTGLNDIPGRFVFRTRIAGGSLADRMLLSNDGVLSIDVIGELTGAEGVTVDGLLIKDGSAHSVVQAYALAALQLATGLITAPVTPYVLITSQTGADDTFAGISAGATDGDVVRFSNTSGDTITVEHLGGEATGSERLSLLGGEDVVLSVTAKDWIEFRFLSGIGWFETDRSVPASTTQSGIVQLANVAETNASSSSVLAVPPSGLAAPDRTIPVRAGAWQPTTTAPCTGPTQQEAPVNDVDHGVMDFAKDVVSSCWVHLDTPGNWDGTLTYRVTWTAISSGSGVVTWGLKGISYADSDVIDTAYGTEVEVDDTLTTLGDIMISPESAAVTLAGSPAGGEHIQLKFSHVGTAGNDTFTGVARMMSVRITYGTNKYSD